MHPAAQVILVIGLVVLGFFAIIGFSPNFRK